MSVRRGLCAAVGVVLLGVAAASAQEIRRIETLGVVPGDPGALADRAPRDAALDDAVTRAVLRVGLEELARLRAAGGSGAPPSPRGGDGGSEEDAARVLAALGDRPLEYAVRFRILEDRGRRSRLLLADPGVETEYVVLVEVQVDVERVRARLSSAGLVGGEAGSEPIPPRVVRLEIESLPSWRAYAALRAALLEHAGATAVRPVEFERGHAVVDLDSTRSPRQIYEALRRALPPELRIVPVDAGRRRLTLRVVESAPLGDSPPEAAPASSRRRDD
ncbi:MAG: hypothetical protein JSU66_09490 [Deltaproteobacteria bacterium]|nr:MAG: hypothetical protein JSU66_09490 [Deltaproteobacteria bacterium]